MPWRAYTLPEHFGVTHSNCSTLLSQTRCHSRAYTLPISNREHETFYCYSHKIRCHSGSYSLPDFTRGTFYFYCHKKLDATPGLTRFLILSGNSKLTVQSLYSKFHSISQVTKGHWKHYPGRFAICQVKVNFSVMFLRIKQALTARVTFKTKVRIAGQCFVIFCNLLLGRTWLLCCEIYELETDAQSSIWRGKPGSVPISSFLLITSETYSWKPAQYSRIPQNAPRKKPIELTLKTGPYKALQQNLLQQKRKGNSKLQKPLGHNATTKMTRGQKIWACDRSNF